MNISQYESEDKYVGPILRETQIIFCCQKKKMEIFQRYISQIYLCNGNTVSRFLYVSANMCIRLCKNICNVCVNYSTITTVMTMTNQPEEPDSWDVIDNHDMEAEQQSFLLSAAVALSFLELYGPNLKPVQIPKWEHQ
jgi:hypothetical protein